MLIAFFLEICFQSAQDKVGPQVWIKLAIFETIRQQYLLDLSRGESGQKEENGAVSWERF